MEIEIKTYSHDGVFKKQLNPRDIISDVLNFQEELNGGQGNLDIQLYGNLSDFQHGDIIEIRSSIYGDIYTGIIENLKIDSYKDIDIISIELYGVSTALNDIEFKQSGLRAFTLNGTVGEMIIAIIDSFNSQYGSLTDTVILNGNLIQYTPTSIDISGTSKSMDFSKESCFSALRKVITDSGFDFYIGVDGVILVTKPVNQFSRKYTFNRDLLSLKRTISKKNLVNKLYLTRKGGTEKTYSDAVSISEYGLKEKTISNTSLANESSQDFYGDGYISIEKFPKEYIEMKVFFLNSNEVRPGMRVSTLNSNNNIQDLIVKKIEKRKDYFTLYLGEFPSFGKTVLGKG